MENCKILGRGKNNRLYPQTVKDSLEIFKKIIFLFVLLLRIMYIIFDFLIKQLTTIMFYCNRKNCSIGTFTS